MLNGYKKKKKSSEVKCVFQMRGDVDHIQMFFTYEAKWGKCFFRMLDILVSVITCPIYFI